MYIHVYTYVDEVFEVSLLYVEENGGLVEISQVGHVLNSIYAGLMHGQNVVRSEAGPGERVGLEGGEGGGDE